MVAATPSTSQLGDSFRPGPLSLPQALTDALRLSPEQFAQLCRANPESVLELAADGSLISMTPTGRETGGRNGALLVELGLALRNGNLPYKLFDSSTGFHLRDGSVRSPDASLVAVESWRAQATLVRAGLRHCVKRWPLSGQRRQARLAAEPLRIEAATSLDGAPQMPGLTIELAEVWAV
jgi:hypothetical protein